MRALFLFYNKNKILRTGLTITKHRVVPYGWDNNVGEGGR